MIAVSRASLEKLQAFKQLGVKFQVGLVHEQRFQLSMKWVRYHDKYED
jgi:predicted dithiol-disulfide oxidoreductase (DUF899 family)